MRMISRTVPRPTYIRASFRSNPILVRDLIAKTSCHDVNREDGPCEWRPVTMSARFLLRLTFVAVVLVAITGAFVQLASGRRPVLLGGRLV
jgi:hypothetical protein